MTWQIREQRYKTGEEIRLGDQIRYAGSCGIVTSVIYGRDCSSENQNGEGSDHAIALTVTTDAHPLILIDQAERDLEFLGRGFSKESSRGGKMINYFEPPATAKEEIIRRIKGNYRRRFVSRAMQDQGVASVPDLWKNHEFSEVLKNWLGRQSPQFRGGEDLPDLEIGEVEIARLTLANSVHGEVTSLRAKLTKEDGKISLRMVDEYESEIKLPY